MSHITSTRPLSAKVLRAAAMVAHERTTRFPELRNIARRLGLGNALPEITEIEAQRIIDDLTAAYGFPCDPWAVTPREAELLRAAHVR